MSNVQIPNLGAAIALNGTEQLEAVQAGTSVRVTTQQISNFTRGSLDTVAAGKVLGRDTASGTGPVQELPIAVDASGNVGIGTSAPTINLQVAGTYAQMGTLDGTVDNRFISTSGGNAGIFGTVSNHPLVAYTNNTERMRIDASGNVGIGTSSPDNKLVVVSASSQITATDGTVSQAVGYAAAGLAYSGTYTNHPFGFLTNNVERVRITATGDVGIGTSSPSYSRLHLLGSGVTQGLKVESTSTTQFDGAAIYMRGAAGTTRSTGFIHINTNVGGTSSAFNLNSYGATDNYLSTLASYEYSSNQWIFYTNSAERIRIDAAGRVGIGTSAPDASSLLDVTSTTGGVLFPRMTGTQRDAIGSPANGLVLYNTTTNKLQVRAAGAWVDLH
jgi:hypothetical protein